MTKVDSILLEVIESKSSINTNNATLASIEQLDRELAASYRHKFRVQPALSRALVSFQANKERSIYRWYKYKEAFSAALVEYLFSTYHVQNGKVLDPFAGSGTALFAASALGLDADGTELLPIGHEIIRTRQVVEAGLAVADIERLKQWIHPDTWQNSPHTIPIPELRITRGAYPERTKTLMSAYLGAAQFERPCVQAVLRFALLCVLESVSFTRKDGQYLRWDYRSGRRQGVRPFDKGRILEFDTAISAKIAEIIDDLTGSAHQIELFPMTATHGAVRLLPGSCLEVMPSLPSFEYDAVITSPPYCNRYDYTRTYALELALLGVDEQEIVGLRQSMLSCTVENRSKNLQAINPAWERPLQAADNESLLQEILNYLEGQKALGALNNDGIPRMVRGYFYEMACVIFEAARVVKKGAPLFMVNDNVRYAGASISVDMILSHIAEALGFDVESIYVLPQGKGNSSQQMGEHGREQLRKCVYIWRKRSVFRCCGSREGYGE
jgi:DNA modification methylase